MAATGRITGGSPRPLAPNGPVCEWLVSMKLVQGDLHAVVVEGGLAQSEETGTLQGGAFDGGKLCSVSTGRDHRAGMQVSGRGHLGEGHAGLRCALDLDTPFAEHQVGRVDSSSRDASFLICSATARAARTVALPVANMVWLPREPES